MKIFYISEKTQDSWRLCLLTRFNSFCLNHRKVILKSRTLKNQTLLFFKANYLKFRKSLEYRSGYLISRIKGKS